MKLKNLLNAFRKEEQPADDNLDDVVSIVEKTDVHEDVHPLDPFWKVAPKIHLYPEALKRVESFGRLTEGYARALSEKYDNHLPFEIEKKVICRDVTHLIHYLSRAGIIWSDDAEELLKEKHPTTFMLLFKK